MANKWFFYNFYHIFCQHRTPTNSRLFQDSSKAPLGYQPGQPVTEPYIPGIGVPGIPFPPPAISVPPPGYPVPGMKRAYDGGYEPASKRLIFLNI